MSNQHSHVCNLEIEDYLHHYAALRTQMKEVQANIDRLHQDARARAFPQRSLMDKIIQWVHKLRSDEQHQQHLTMLRRRAAELKNGQQKSTYDLCIKIAKKSLMKLDMETLQELQILQREVDDLKIYHANLHAFLANLHHMPLDHRAYPHDFLSTLFDKCFLDVHQFIDDEKRLTPAYHVFLNTHYQSVCDIVNELKRITSGPHEYDISSESERAEELIKTLKLSCFVIEERMAKTRKTWKEYKQKHCQPGYIELIDRGLSIDLDVYKGAVNDLKI